MQFWKLPCRLQPAQRQAWLWRDCSTFTDWYSYMTIHVFFLLSAAHQAGWISAPLPPKKEGLKSLSYSSSLTEVFWPHTMTFFPRPIWTVCLAGIFSGHLSPQMLSGWAKEVVAHTSAHSRHGSAFTFGFFFVVTTVLVSRFFFKYKGIY